jgi:hypothetical protein
MPTFITPTGYSGQAELTAANGLTIEDQGRWTYNRFNYSDGAGFGLSLGNPAPASGGELHLSATNWSIAVIGNTLTSYTDPDSGTTYGPARCRIQVTGQWQIPRNQNSDSFNSIGVLYTASTHTDLGNRDMYPWLLNYTTDPATYVIQGADVAGGAQDTFSAHEFYCRLTEQAGTDNSNHQFQSNSVTRPVWIYTYAKSWQID